MRVDIVPLAQTSRSQRAITFFIKKKKKKITFYTSILPFNCISFVPLLTLMSSSFRGGPQTFLATKARKKNEDKVFSRLQPQDDGQRRNVHTHTQAAKEINSTFSAAR